MTQKPPLTSAEIQHKLRNGELKIESAPQELVEFYSKEVDKILLVIGATVMDEDYPGHWASSCFVTDLSMLGDFCRDEIDITSVGNKLGFPVARDMFIWQIAKRIHGVQ